MAPRELYDGFVTGFPQRKFSAGLLVSFIDLMLHLDSPSSSFKGFEDFLRTHVQHTILPGGRRANTLIVDDGRGSTISIRGFYDEIELYFRADQHRRDYPSCAPHATQAWGDYHDWLDSLVTYTEKQLKQLRKQVVRFVLESLPSHEFDPSTVTLEPPLFARIVEGFDLTPRKGETTGAAFQGVVFGFLRADNPHLQVEISKVRTGSKRIHRVADIDAWEGKRLAISAEVKQFALSIDQVSSLQSFADEVAKRGALGMVVALEFEEGACTAIESLGLVPLDTTDLLAVVQLWDPLKQRTAVASLVYYVTHIEQSFALASRLDEFIKSIIDPGAEAACEE